MSRFLFVIAPLTGHVHPAHAIGRSLQAAGHEVAWVGSERFLRPLLGETTTVYPTGLRPYRGMHDRGARAIKSLWDGFVLPLSRAILPAVERAVDAYQPDLLMVDQSALAGALVAHRRELPWATLATGAMHLTRPFRHQPGVEAWIQDRLATLAPDAGVDLRFSPYLVVALTSPALTGPEPLPEHSVLVGPALGDRPPVPGFGWDRLDPDRELVLVSMGTLAQDLAADFYGRAVRALHPLGHRLQAVVVAPDSAVPDPPGHLLVTARAPVLALMPRLAAVVCHAGNNLTCEALTYGVPLVVAPIRLDQPVVAGQVAAAGAGIRVRFGRVTPEQLCAAITAVLDDKSYRAAAARVRDSFPPGGGAGVAARHLAALAAGRASDRLPAAATGGR